ncbi:MAG TPA: hypothetical protein VN030_07620 [Cellvibrio sp.]|nr:hypothetical protein [Cellvibrio sp.]
MAMTPTDFKDIADGIQSLVLAMGIVIGGCWTLYTFRNLGTAQKARAELLAMERSQEPGFQLTINTDIVPTAEKSAYTLLIKLELKNPSRRTVVLDMSQPSVSVARMDMDGKTTPAIDGKPIQINSVAIDGKNLRKQQIRYLRAGDLRNTVYVCNVEEPGLYLVQAQVLYASGNLKRDVKEISDEHAVLAVEQAIVNVQPVAEKTFL